MEVMGVHGPEFKAYGRVIEGYDVSGLMKTMEFAPLSEEVVYMASVLELEALSAAKELADGIYGQMKVQVGYCSGRNRKLNAPECHRDSEVSLAVKDLILLLGKRQDIPEDFTYDASKVKASLVPAGTLIEVHVATLHYAPYETGDEGFHYVVMFLQGTNMELDHRPVDRRGKGKLLVVRSKWLIGHEKDGLDEGAWTGLTGENISLSWSHKKKMEDTYYD